MSTVERQKVVDEHNLKVAEGDSLHVGIQDVISKTANATRRGGDDSGVHKRRFSEVTKERDEKEVAKQAQQYFFDFNTVELLLLASSILVCVFGIMFESPTQNERAWDYGLGILTIMVISTSVLYYFTVFLSELVGACDLAGAWWMLWLIRRFANKEEETLQRKSERMSMSQGAFTIAANPMMKAEPSLDFDPLDELNAKPSLSRASSLSDRDRMIRKLEEENQRAKEKLKAKPKAGKKGRREQGSVVLEMSDLYY